jgi:multidrug efflux pump subunit AcrA (membrane-fusion protein)
VSLFRAEAVAHHRAPAQHGDVLRMSPAWRDWTFRLLLLMAATAVVYAACARLTQYARGPAMVRVEGRTDVTVTAPGIVEEVLVRPGHRVEAGQPLVRLHDEQERGDLDRVEHEFELELVRLLGSPGDQAVRTRMSALRAERSLARSRMSSRLLRAPQPGFVSDVRIRAGQSLAPGEIAVSIVGAGARFSVVSFLPGQYRPLLRPGMRLRLELSGYLHVYQEVVVEAVSDELIGPAEARRYLGQERADALALPGAVVLVSARLPERGFLFDGQSYSYYDGMQGLVEIGVRRESLLLTLIPGLRAVLHHV